ncbi:MAG: glycosyltransferase, partial [Patescibacteria group bacterium]|nr:glycosyltransferase [Patescibacteria group bacterium]
MKNYPKISIIIPACNEEAMIGRALESIQRGGYPAHEIIVVINGTTDSTAGIAEKMRAKIVYFEKALGYSKARNEGASRASGDILVFMDADSLMGPNVLLAVAQSSAEPKVCGTVLGGADSAKIKYKIFFLIKNTAHKLGFYKGVLGGLFFCEAELFKFVGGYDDSLAVN